MFAIVAIIPLMCAQADGPVPLTPLEKLQLEHERTLERLAKAEKAAVLAAEKAKQVSDKVNAPAPNWWETAQGWLGLGTASGGGILIGIIQWLRRRWRAVMKATEVLQDEIPNLKIGFRKVVGALTLPPDAQVGVAMVEKSLDKIGQVAVAIFTDKKREAQ